MSESFDAVRFMRRRREEIDREDEGLTWEEKAQKTRLLVRNDPLWKRLSTRVIEVGTPWEALRPASTLQISEPDADD